MLSARKEKNMVMGQIITQGWTQSGGLLLQGTTLHIILRNEQSELVLGFQAEEHQGQKPPGEFPSGPFLRFSPGSMGSVRGPISESDPVILCFSICSFV